MHPASVEVWRKYRLGHKVRMLFRNRIVSNDGDIGCAVGSWIGLACDEPLLRESDFCGIEVARHLL